MRLYEPEASATGPEPSLTRPARIVVVYELLSGPNRPTTPPGADDLGRLAGGFLTHRGSGLLRLVVSLPLPQGVLEGRGRDAFVIGREKSFRFRGSHVLSTFRSGGKMGKPGVH
jgi:hypothetical protein